MDAIKGELIFHSTNAKFYMDQRYFKILGKNSSNIIACQTNKEASS